MIPDELLNTAWSLNFVFISQRQTSTLSTLLQGGVRRTEASQTFDSLASDLHQYLDRRSHTEVTDELNDQNERSGRLSDCSVSYIRLRQTHNDSISSSTDENAAGILIEARFQKTTCKAAVLISRNTTDVACPLTLVLYKGSQKFYGHLTGWLYTTFDLPRTEQLTLTPDTILCMGAAYVDSISSNWSTTASQTDAYRLATIKQAVGNFKITITFSAARNPEIASRLKHIELDIPAETVNILVSDVSSPLGRDGFGDAFLNGLGNAIFEKTGLKIPLVPGKTSQDSQADGDNLNEAPLKISKISCAAFVMSTEGKVKFSSKPIENAEAVGYDEEIVRSAMWRIMGILLQEAERRAEETVVQ